MNKVSMLALVAVISLATSCKDNKKESKNMESTETEMVTEDNMIEKKSMDEETVEVEKVIVALNAKSNSNVSGNVTFIEENGKITMTANMSGLETGMHAIHLHETADCSSDDGKSAGGHWNPTGQPHGKWGDEAGYHKGDIGNFEADADGNATVTFTTDQWCIGCDDSTKNILGKGVIVHQGQDDFTSQPSGAAGARISCAGVIE